MEIDTDTRELVARALLEDLGSGDVTAEAVVPEDATGNATITQKEPGVLFGLDVAAEAFRQTGAGELEDRAAEREWRNDVPAVVARAGGPARALLAAERTALNLLCHLSGVATLTARFVREIEGTGARILDTRKTTPGLRELEKAAVAAGGGSNHRMGLYDAILIKENHAALAGGVGEAVRRARETKPELPVEVECRDLDEVREAAEAGADRLLLDNMSPGRLRDAVAAARESGDAPELEASGGVTLETVGESAAPGVDCVSVGALTHSAPALDLSMTIDISICEGAPHMRGCAVRRNPCSAGGATRLVMSPPTAAMRKKREAIVLEHMESENRYEFDVTLDTFDHPRYELIATGDVYDGPQEVSDYFEETRRAFPDQRNELLALHHSDDAVLVEAIIRGTHRGPLRSLPPTGREYELRILSMFVFEEDRLLCERVYFDQLTVLRQLGIARDPTSLTGRVETLIGHPLTIGRGLIRRVIGR